MDVKALKAGTISRGITVRDDEVLPGEERVVDRLILKFRTLKQLFLP